MVTTEDLDNLLVKIKKDCEKYDERGEYTFSYSIGNKFCRIIRSYYGSNSAYCFVDMATGDIYKSSGWSSRAKGIRGNIYSLDGIQFDVYRCCFYRQ